MSGVRWKEDERLAALRGYRILDTSPEVVFDELVSLAARICDAPIALLSFVEERRQWFKAEVGLGIRETPLHRSICVRTILQPGLTVIHDLSEDPRFSANPLVAGEPFLRFYAGAMLETSEGLPLGTLCVLDDHSRSLSADQADSLAALARQAMALLDLRRAALDRDEALEASRVAEQRQAKLVRELHHRVRNTLAVVQSLLGLTARRGGSLPQFYRSFSERIASLARTHALLTENGEQMASLRQMAQSELAPYGAAGNRVKLHGPEVDLPAELAVPLGLALHELATNAAKHGALSVELGDLEVTWDVVAGEGKRKLCLEWVEHSGQPAPEPTHQGFGTTLLRKVLPMQVDAAVDIQYRTDGVRCRIEAPIRAEPSSALWHSNSDPLSTP